MNYYPHHIGDFNSATRHLTRVERSLYRDLIELYYDTEQPLPADDFDRLARRVIAQSDDEKDALRYVLDEFFALDGNLYRHERCDEEIQKYQSQITAKSNAGKASARSRQAKKVEQSQPKSKQTSNTNEQPLNSRSTDEQLTKNQEPRTNTSDTDVSGAVAPAEPSEIIFGRGVPLLTAAGVSERNARSMLGMLRKTHGDEDVIAALQACVDARAMEPVAYLQGVLRAAKNSTKPRSSRADERASWMASFWEPPQQTMKDMGVIHAVN